MSTEVSPFRVAIVGAGPAGFYAAEALLATDDFAIEVDLLDALPTPFGLVRSGVAPDHQKIKSVTRVFDKVAAHPRFRFFGNVRFAEHLALDDLTAHYHQILFATGAQTDRRLGIPGEDLAGSHSATAFVWWYNGHPDYRDCAFDLSCERAVVVGVGNVAVDVARILCRTPEELEQTDIADYALAALRQSRVREVVVLGRRGPAQAAFTAPEVKELGEMADADFVVRPEEATPDACSQADLDAAADRLTLKKVALLREAASRPPAIRTKRIIVRFLVSPTEILDDGTGHVGGVRLVRNQLTRTEDGSLRPRATGETEDLACGLVFRAIGYRGVPLPGVPFHERWGVVPNVAGRVTDEDGRPARGLYVAGWIKRGASGVIGTNKPDAQETVTRMLADAAAGRHLQPGAPQAEAAERRIRQRQPDCFTYADWKRLDAVETEAGARRGRPRVKLTRVEDMLRVCRDVWVAAPRQNGSSPDTGRGDPKAGRPADAVYTEKPEPTPVAMSVATPPAARRKETLASGRAESLDRATVTIDGNEAAAYVAHRTNEVVAIYPITPASPMGELADLWTAHGEPNLWGTVPHVIEMQSEGGAAGAVHGALQAGSLTTTFTASQGLLLMLPNMYKIAGELTPTVFHIAARSLAAQALSIFGDHSDVMAARATGWGMLFAGSVQEVMDFALIAQAATLKARVPFLHIFDGFRTSHEVRKIERLSTGDLRALLSDDLIRAHRARALSPDRPVLRGTAQNPDVFFQARETVNPYYLAAPDLVQETMDEFAEQVGRPYRLFDYVGAEDAERVVVLMGSGVETAEEAVQYLARQGEKVGVLKVRLFRPFALQHFLDALPATVRAVAVLDRTKEPGAAGEPLYQDVVTALAEGIADGTAPFGTMPRVGGGRYGLSSKEFTPAMVKAVLDNLAADPPKNHFTVGIHDDVTHTSLDVDERFDTEGDEVTRALFWGLGSDGTVGANKNTIKIIGEETDLHAQGYFVYDSRKAGARTISHLRFGPDPIHSAYLIRRAGFVAVHQFGFLERYDTLALAEEGATVLLNSPHGPDEVWDRIPRSVQEQILRKKLTLWTIDAYAVAQRVGLGARINTIMQPCFFALSGVLPRDEALENIKKAIRKTYGKRGEAVVRMNYAAVDAALAHLHQVDVPDAATSTLEPAPPVPDDAPAFVQDVTAVMLAGEGDRLPVSALPDDGTYPLGTTRYEKRNLALEVPVWEPDLCIQCGKCVMVCPHAVIRAKLVEPERLADAPKGFASLEPAWRELKDQRYVLSVAVEDCTGCKLCVEVCPAKDKRQVNRKALNMQPQLPLREIGREHWDFFEALPENTRADIAGDGAATDGRGDAFHPLPVLSFAKSKDVQLLEPLFEFSGACAGCGETPYLSLLTRLFGDRALIANATGCSSIYGGNLPTTPWATNAAGRGPAWSNSLFEDNAEFGLGMRLALDKQAAYARELVAALAEDLGADLADAILDEQETTPAAIERQRARVATLKARLEGHADPKARDLASLADALVSRSLWIVGGDGWAYDIGYGGLDHVLASGRNVNVLVLDTEVYSNTGGQASKATGLGAVAKFAAGGKPTPKKDLGLLAMGYGYVYVAQIAMGADDNQTVKAFEEAEAYDGPSLLIAYSHCIAHGIDMTKGMHQQDLAVKSGYWPLYRFDPRRAEEGRVPLQLDSKAPKLALQDYLYNENRYRMLTQVDPAAAKAFLAQAKALVRERWAKYEALAHPGGDGQAGPSPGAPPRPQQGPPDLQVKREGPPAPSTKPARPPGVKPARPPGVKPAGVKPAGPPGTKKPKLPPKG